MTTNRDREMMRRLEAPPEVNPLDKFLVAEQLRAEHEVDDPRLSRYVSLEDMQAQSERITNWLATSEQVQRDVQWSLRPLEATAPKQHSTPYTTPRRTMTININLED